MANTHHVVLTVTAHVVDVCDSGNPGNNKLSSYAVSVDTRPCPTCVGIALLDHHHLSKKEKADVQLCLAHVLRTLEAMLADATNCIKTQAAAWTLGDTPKCPNVGQVVP